MTLPQSTLDGFTTLEQFRDYFAGIPDKNWCRLKFVRGEKCCARGHLGEQSEYEEIPSAVYNFSILVNLTIIELAAVNDGRHPKFKQNNPRQRILAAIDEAIERRDLR